MAPITQFTVGLEFKEGETYDEVDQIHVILLFDCIERMDTAVGKLRLDPPPAGVDINSLMTFAEVKRLAQPSLAVLAQKIEDALSKKFGCQWTASRMGPSRYLSTDKAAEIFSISAMRSGAGKEPRASSTADCGGLVKDKILVFINPPTRNARAKLSRHDRSGKPTIYQ
jgi:hypothetical protein